LNSNSIEKTLIGIGNQPNYGSSIMKKAHVHFPFSYSCKWIDWSEIVKAWNST
jgi:hypothetical protein